MDYNARDIGVGGAIWVAAIILLIASILSITQVIQYAKHQYFPDAQKKLYIVLLGPVLIGWPCWLILIFGTRVGLLEVATDIMKALIVYFFIEYTIKIIGWEIDSTGSHFNAMKVDTAISAIEKVKHRLPCFGHVNLKDPKHVHSFLRRVKAAVIQYGIVFFFSAIASGLLLYYDGDRLNYGSMNLSSGYVYINFIKIFTSIYAMYWTLQFLRVVRQIPELKFLHMNPKFKTIELVFILTNLQPTIIGFLASYGLIADYTDSESVRTIAGYTSNLLLCVEMIIFAFVQRLVFPLNDYKNKSSFEPLIPQSKI